MEARLLQIETPELFRNAVYAAVDLLRAGEVVAVPTETVYGLAGNAWDTRAVVRIFEVKGRPRANPIIVHVASRELARACVEEWPESAERLAKKFWPGPLTLVLPKSGRVPEIVSAGGKTVGIRWPLHPFMQELIGACGFPLAAPSANPANQISPTSAEHVLRALGARIPLIVDAGRCAVGIESTVLDLSVDPPRLLRPGMVSRREIELALGLEIVEGALRSKELKSPGLMARHYAPRARLWVREWSGDEELLRIAEATGEKLDQVHVIAHDVLPRRNHFGRVAIIPHDAEAYARAIYGELHRSDELGAGAIIVENPPEGPEWSGIRDRLRRASAEPKNP